MSKTYPRTAAAALAALAFGVAGAATADSSCGLNMNPADLDTNGDVALTPAEVRGTALAPVFDDVDTNHDGSIGGDEWGGRCAAVSAARNKRATETGANAGWGEGVAAEKTDRQKERQANRINSRVDQETDQAADSLVDKAMDTLFGD